MPLYDFRCKACGKIAEVLVKSFKEKVSCEECGHDTERLVSRPGGFRLKGAGFYANDYGRASQKETDAARRAADSIAEQNPDMPALDQE